MAVLIDCCNHYTMYTFMKVYIVLVEYIKLLFVKYFQIYKEHSIEKCLFSRRDRTTVLMNSPPLVAWRKLHKIK